LPGHPPIHLGLRGVPRHQPRLLVFKASKRRLSLERRGRVPSRGQWRGGGMLAAAATSGAPLSSTVTTSAPSTSPPTPFSTSARSISRSTSTLCGNVWPSVMSVSCTCRRHPSSRTSSRRVCLLQCFWSFSPVSTFAVARVSTAGRC
jgi:hypothetical protein